jgi:hypothetical protein
MNAKRIVLVGSPHMRQSMMVPQSQKKAARLSSVTYSEQFREVDLI